MALRSPWRFVNRCNKSSCPELKSAKSVSLLCCIGQSAHTHTPDSLFFANGCGGRSRMIATPHPCRCLALFFDQIIVRLNTSVARVDCHLACVPGRTVGQTERERERERSANHTANGSQSAQPTGISCFGQCAWRLLVVVESSAQCGSNLSAKAAHVFVAPGSSGVQVRRPSY